MPSALLELFPSELRGLLDRVSAATLEVLEEVRIREGRPLEIGYGGGRSAFIKPDGAATDDYRVAYKPGRAECRALLERVTDHSLYAVEEELRRGYVTVAGGHRIGLVGRTVLEGGAVRHLRDIAGFNVRIARARTGCASSLLPLLLDLPSRTIEHTLIISAPQQGKTTLLRDLARSISTGEWHHPAAAGWGGRKVGVVDERSEIAACERGVPTFDLGPRTDVLDACPKAEGLMMLVRSMSPEVVVVDEIGRPEDAYALTEALHAGVRVVATAHAIDLKDVFARPVLADLARLGMFSTFVLLSRTQGRFTHRVIHSDEARYEAGERTQQRIRANAASETHSAESLLGTFPSREPSLADDQVKEKPAHKPLWHPPPAAEQPGHIGQGAEIPAGGRSEARLTIKSRTLPTIRSPNDGSGEGNRRA